MRVAVIGVGQLGRAILDRCWDRQTRYSDTDGKTERYNYVGIPHEKLDVTAPDASDKLVALLEKFKPSVVVNAAAMHVTRDCENHPGQAFAVNAAGAYNVAVACVNLRAMHVYVSSDYVFSRLAQTNFRDTSPPVKTVPAFDTLDRPQPTTVYGISKMAGEHITTNVSPNSAIVRVSHLFGGTGSRQKRGNFVLQILERMRDEEDLNYYDNVHFTPTYCKDAAKMILSIRDPGVYHVCNRGTTTPFLFAKAVVKLAGGDPVSVKAVAFEDDPREHYTHPRFTSLVPSFESARKWEEALAEYVPQAQRIIAQGRDNPQQV